MDTSTKKGAVSLSFGNPHEEISLTLLRQDAS